MQRAYFKLRSLADRYENLLLFKGSVEGKTDFIGQEFNKLLEFFEEDDGGFDVPPEMNEHIIQMMEKVEKLYIETGSVSRLYYCYKSDQINEHQFTHAVVEFFDKVDSEILPSSEDLKEDILKFKYSLKIKIPFAGDKADTEEYIATIRSRKKCFFKW